jgi:hypothetical protein
MDAPSFIDGLGRRFAVTTPGGERLETLRLCAEIPATPENQAAIVERASSLAQFTHPGFARVTRIEQHAAGPRASLAVVSEKVDGVRLSDLLRESERRRAERDVDAAVQLLLQATACVAALHQHAPDAAHGAIGPERVILRADGAVVLVEHVLGGALEALQCSRLQLWALFRVPAPSTASRVRLDQQADVMQLGVLALALLLGRVLRREEFPHALPAVLEEAAAPDAGRNYAGCPRAVRGWIARALQFEARGAFRSAVEAERALAGALREGGTCRPSTAAVQRFLAGCSFGSLGPVPSGANLHVSSSGAVVSVGCPDRGSGAHRVSRQAPDALESPRLVAEFPVTPPVQGSAIAPAEPPVMAAAERPQRRNWLSRLLPR